MGTRLKKGIAHLYRMNKIYRDLTIAIIFILFMASCTQAETPTDTVPQTGPTTVTQPSTPRPPQAPSPKPTDEPTEPSTETPALETGMQLVPCASAAQISLIQTAVPVTPTATGGPSPTPRPATPTPRPAPSEDRVGFPTGYQENFKVMGIYDRQDNRQVRVICGNDTATSVKQGEPFPYGSILVMETWRAKLDANGEVVKDTEGHFVRESLSGIFVMRKEQGFGEAYQGLRTGEWEYVAYHPDGSHLIPPQNTANCASCHVGAGEDKDWVFRADVLFFDPDRFAAAPAPGENEVYMNSISFGPRTIKVKAGTEITWTNHDGVDHTVMTEDGSVNSGELAPGESFKFSFDTPGTYAYHCSLHPEQMEAVIEVEE